MRFKFILVCFFIFIVFVILRLFQIQIINHKFYKAEIEKRIPKDETYSSKRGEIVSSDGFPLAINLMSFDLIAIPAYIENGTETALKLAPFLGFKEEILNKEMIEETEETKNFKDLISRLSDKSDFYEPLARELTLDQMQQIKALNLKGIEFETKYRRYYPEKELFAQIIGFLGWRNNQKSGQYGLEEFFDKELEKGDSLVLTINRPLQFFVYERLKEALEKYEAESGTVIVLDASTGEILSLVNLPSFDPNQYSKITDFSLFKNSAISDGFEPGSIFKVITMAAGLEEKKVTPLTTYVDTGEVKIGSDVIKNAGNKIFKEQTMSGVLENSINTGAVFVADKLGHKSFRDYVKKFGFGNLSGVELSGEVKGDISNLDKKGDIYLATGSFGQGLTVTPLQMVKAVGAIANRGQSMKPFIVKEIKKSNGEIVQIEPEASARVMSQGSALDLTNMMTGVTERGFGKLARVPGFFVAGKTGTAQIPEAGKYTEKTNHSFIGFLPANRSRFAILVKLKDPKKEKYAESTAAPLFGEIGKFLVEFYNLGPER
ncbi:hypothetical protein COW09_01175 [bacterium (Candidatus Moisslbacteria) CG12_big_fil_rev_8_21_14_0_65_36_11]|nr:MAG: hypothetical protein COW09_01175 [bacterium (Candidatus Moisslbacteria) CG12_big_fil_rev_8_21_14_0_65_36_11]